MNNKWFLPIVLGAAAVLVGVAVFVLARPSAKTEALHAMPCKDLDGDGAVTLADIIIEITYYGQSVPPAPAAADMNGNNSIGLPDDILAVIIAFGTFTGCQDTPIGAKGVTPPTPTPGPSLSEMSLTVKGPGADCDVPVKPTKCTIEPGATFTLGVEVNSTPAGGYVGFQAKVNYGGLVYHPDASTTNEIVWPAEAVALRVPPAPTGLEGIVSHSSSSGILPPMPLSTYVGNVVQLRLSCPPGGGTFPILLPLYSPGNQFGTTFYTDNFATRVLPDGSGGNADTLGINCATALESTSGTVGAGGGSLATGTGDPVEVHLSIPPGALPANTAITVAAYNTADVTPPPGNGPLLSRSFAFSPAGLVLSVPAMATFTYTDAEVAGFDEAHLGVAQFNDLTQQWELANVILRDTVSNTLTVEVTHFSARTFSHDFDGDGCVNSVEQLTADGTEGIGGRRDAFNQWDFFDVEGPNHSPVPDHFIDLPNDILGVAFHYTPAGNPYDPVYDRAYAQIPPDHIWNSGPPDGNIGLGDVLTVGNEYQHDCRTPP